MDPTKRYFINQLPDYAGGDVIMPNTEVLIRRVLDHVKDINTKWDRKARVGAKEYREGDGMLQRFHLLST